VIIIFRLKIHQTTTITFVEVSSPSQTFIRRNMSWWRWWVSDNLKHLSTKWIC